jgi:hypothetical protein
MLARIKRTATSIFNDGRRTSKKQDFVKTAFENSAIETTNNIRFNSSITRRVEDNGKV